MCHRHGSVIGLPVCALADNIWIALCCYQSLLYMFALIVAGSDSSTRRLKFCQQEHKASSLIQAYNGRATCTVGQD